MAGCFIRCVFPWSICLPCVNEIVKGIGNGIAAVTGAISMVILVKVIVPKFPKLMEYSLGIAMLVGICCSLLYDVIFI